MLLIYRRIKIAVLYIVPTPIGNFNDITLRALHVLNKVNFIAAEDTRITGLLLHHFKIKTKMISLHSYNEKIKSKKLILQLKNGIEIALVSDAGTPLINDPGYYLVKQCYLANIQVIPLPGPCAAITALSASGISSNRFCYEGFLPVKSQSRQNILKKLIYEPRTIIFYEVTHRLLNTIKDMIAIFGNKRYVVLARELTKTWESIQGFPLNKLLDWLQYDKKRYSGEMVLLVEGYKNIDKNESEISVEVLKILSLLKTSLSFKQAISIVSKFYKIKKKILYKYLLNENNLIK